MSGSDGKRIGLLPAVTVHQLLTRLDELKMKWESNEKKVGRGETTHMSRMRDSLGESNNTRLDTNKLSSEAPIQTDLTMLETRTLPCYTVASLHDPLHQDPTMLDNVQRRLSQSTVESCCIPADDACGPFTPDVHKIHCGKEDDLDVATLYGPDDGVTLKDLNLDDTSLHCKLVSF